MRPEPLRPWDLTPIQKGPPRGWISLLDLVDTQITNLARDRLTWKTAQAVTSNSAAIAEQPYFANWIAGLYASSMALGIRKLNDNDPRSASFFNLMEKMARSPEKLTREWFSSGVLSGLAPGMDDAFTKVADPTCLGHLDPAVVRADQSRLAKVAGDISHYVNQHVAHVQSKPNAAIPTYGDLHAAVDVMCELLRKYIHLLKRADRIECEPIFQMPWDRVFEQAWSLPNRTS